MEYADNVSYWIDCEREIKSIINSFSILFQNENKIRDGLFDEQMVGHLAYTHIKKFGLVMVDTFMSKYYSEIYGFNKIEIMKLLKSQLNDLISALEIYLSTIVGIANLKPIKELDEIHPRYVISFNYTDTYKIYGIDPSNVFHVHGKIDSQPNNMVLGFNDSDPENLDFIYFKKYFQRIQKLTGFLERKTILNKNEISGYCESPTVYFYGHSLDKTDEDIIIELIDLSRKVYIYTKDQEDYEQKVINLISLFEKEKATEMIQQKKIEFVPIKNNETIDPM